MKIQRQHDLGKSDARRRIDDVAAALGSKFSLRSRWEGDDLKITGSGVNGRIAVGDRLITVDLKLGFALVMFESTIKSSIEEAMDKYLS